MSSSILLALIELAILIPLFIYFRKKWKERKWRKKNLEGNPDILDDEMLD